MKEMEMQIHNLIGGVLSLIFASGCIREPQESPDVLAVRRTIDEMIDVRSRQRSGLREYGVSIIQRNICSITNEQDRLKMTLEFVKKVLEFGMPNASYEEQCNIAENYPELLRLGRQIIRQSALGDKFLVDFTVDGLHKSRQLCCAISLENQRPDESPQKFETRVYFLHAMRSFYSYIQGIIVSEFFNEDIMRMSSEIKDHALCRLEELIKITPSEELRRHHPKSIRRNKRNRLIGQTPNSTNQVENGKENSNVPKK